MTPHPTWTAPPGTPALLFDCDGTLADTMPAHYRAWVAMLGPFGIPFPEPRFYAPEISLSDKEMTCHTPSRPLPLVLSAGAPTKVYSG